MKDSPYPLATSCGTLAAALLQRTRCAQPKQVYPYHNVAKPAAPSPPPASPQKMFNDFRLVTQHRRCCRSCVLCWPLAIETGLGATSFAPASTCRGVVASTRLATGQAMGCCSPASQNIPRTLNKHFQVKDPTECTERLKRRTKKMHE